MAKEILHSWKGRPITDPDHADHLETASALNTFHRNMPVHLAEETAHNEYRKDQLHEAGAHHLQGMKASLAVGDHDSAKKHGLIYGLVMKQLGHDVVGEPPPEVTNKAKHLAKQPYAFKAHKADGFVLPSDSTSTND